MTDPIDDEALLARFRDWLQQARAEADPVGRDGVALASDAEPAVGLYRVVEEFTALRHEVKLETKGSRALQEQVETLLPALRQAIDQFRSVGPKEDQAVLAAARPLAEALADLDEALDRGQVEIEKARDRLAASVRSIESGLDAIFAVKSWFGRRALRGYHEQMQAHVRRQVGAEQADQFAALLEGYGLIRSRLRRALDSGQVRRIESVGKPVDPAMMTVIEAVETPEQPPGHVVDEVRRGYTWRGRVLRFAEVRAARERARPPAEATGYVADVSEDEPSPGTDYQVEDSQ